MSPLMSAERVKLTEAQRRFARQLSDEWVYRPYGRGQFASADAFIRRGFGSFEEGQDRYGRKETGFILSRAGRAALEAAGDRS